VSRYRGPNWVNGRPRVLTQEVRGGANKCRRPRVFLVGRHEFEKISVEVTEVD